MKVIDENSLHDLISLIKGETDKKIDKSQLQGGTYGQFLVSDGNGGISFITIANAEGVSF